MILTNLHLKVCTYLPQSTTLLEVSKTRDYLRQGIKHTTNTCFLMDFSEWSEHLVLQVLFRLLQGIN
jgi:hypothetical protein